MKLVLLVIVLGILVVCPALATCPAAWNDTTLSCISSTNWHDFVNNTIHIEGDTTMAASLNMGGHNITNVGTPVGGSDATTKQYVTATVQAMFPVGAVYTCGSNTDPYTLLGFGTWQKVTDL